VFDVEWFELNRVIGDWKVRRRRERKEMISQDFHKEAVSSELAFPKLIIQP